MAGEGSDEELVDAHETLNAEGATAAGGKPALDLKVKLKKKRTTVKGWATRAKNNALALF